MNDIVLNANQAIQLAALGPCILIIGYILISSTRWDMSLLPILFFCSLGAMFFLPILALFHEYSGTKTLKYLLLINKELLPALSFLLIIQFVLGRFPPLIYCLVLAIPFVGGAPLIHLAVTDDSICLANNLCYTTRYIEKLYSVFGGALMSMLIVIVLHRSDITISKKDKNRNHKYWLIITLVMFNLMLTAVDLGVIAEKISTKQAGFIRTMIGIGFVYVVLSSIFRVFSESLGIRPWVLRSKTAIAKDRWVAERITWILREEKPYRNLGFNRKALADLLEVKEHTISRIINERFGKTFSELMNECRIHDAKKALRESKQPITTISFDSGFSSITSFNRVFKEATGFSPSEYRRNKDKIPVNENGDHLN